MSGLECGDPDSYNDRYLPATDSDITIQACFGNCVSDGSCQEETNVNELAKMNRLFTVRPSVAQDFVTIEFSNMLNNKDKEVLVLNSLGAVILNFDIAHSKEYTINTESLSNGLYFIQVGSEGKVSSKKFIIQK